ncbi:STAS domain-containing protein [Bacillus sp. FJAT-27251]|uniref:STAS domain-containing protein n=1 Tax=Bacillus sp. FJAT-27251 TaxID=1684142 RepID=UPI0006A77BB8|nr:STAS domain-containing protein [Bacillus sp. FJAT-27251]
MCPTKFLPQPYFRISTDFAILTVSDRSLEIYEPSGNFLDLVDWESKNKAAQLLAKKDERAEGELIMKTKDSPYALVDVSVVWDKSEGHIICLQKDHRLAELESIVEKHRLRLAETNLELLEKKEQVEKSLNEIKSLSCPFIKLTKGTALVPLFGNLDQKLIQQNEERIMHKAHDGDYEDILFDFNGVGTLTDEGVDAFIMLIKELQIMGISPSIIGIKPNHAFYLNRSPAKLDVPFLNSLSKAFKAIM